MLWRASWVLSFSLKCVEDGGSGLVSLEACSERRGEDFSSGGSLIFVKEPLGASSGVF